MSKSVEIKNQARLPLAKCVQLVLSGLKYRLFRASITVLIIALATAFLMTMLTESVTARRIANVIDAQTAPRNTFLFWVARTSSPMNARRLNKLLVTAEPDGPRGRELMTWGDLNASQFETLSEIARDQTVYYQGFFDELSEGDRRALVGRARGEQIFERLQDEEAWETFAADMEMSDEQMQRPLSEFKEWLDRWAQTRPLREAVRSFRRAFPDSEPRKVFARGGQNLPQALAQLGYVLTPGEYEIVQRQAAFNVDAEKIASRFAGKGIKKQLADRAGIEQSEAGTAALFKETRTDDGARWFVSAVDEAAGESETMEPLGLSPERVQEVAREKLAESRLAQVEASVSQDAFRGGTFGFSGRTLWLIVVSFMVCVVGIANAMLMSVTERFREIATMKCLGATDGFIMINFVLESVMQGVAGGLIGTVLGFVLGLLRSWAKYGWMAVEQMPPSELLMAAGVAFVVGILISAAAAVYPAWIAARLAPMEAMRIE